MTLSLLSNAVNFYNFELCCCVDVPQVSIALAFVFFTQEKLAELKRKEEELLREETERRRQLDLERQKLVVKEQELNEKEEMLSVRSMR